MIETLDTLLLNNHRNINLAHVFLVLWSDDFFTVRLSPGTHDVGVVQIYDNRAWKTICGRDGFGNNEATVVCKELGFQNGEALPLTVFGRRSGSQVRKNLTCTGNETTLLNCTYDKEGTSCLPSSLAYASVSCFNENVTQGKDGCFIQ